MQSKHPWISLALSAAVIAAAGYAGYRMMRHYMAVEVVNAQVRVTPFRIETLGYSFKPESATGEFAFRRIAARTTQGARVLLENTNRMPAESFARKIEFPDGRFLTVADFLKMKATGRFSVEEIANRRRANDRLPPDCALFRNDLVIGNTTAHGEPLVTIQNTDPQGMRYTVLRAPRLSCVDVAWTYEKKGSDGALTKLSEARLVSLAVAEPEATLFDPGTDYREAPPSELQRTFARSIGVTDCTECEKQWAKDDNYYHSRQ